MSWGLVAVAGATVVTGVMGNVSANRARGDANAAAAAQLEFEQQRYDDWNAVYGPIQENLATYYANVTPEYYASVGLETFETQYQTALKRLDEDFAQRGIDPQSGIALSLRDQAELDAAETRAGIRRDAPRMAAQDQQNFLQIGMGSDPSNSMSQTLADQNRYAQQMSQNADIAAGRGWSNAISTVGRGIDAYNNRPNQYSNSGAMTGGPTIDPNIAYT